MIEQKINEFFGDNDSTGVGTGWWIHFPWIDKLFGTYYCPDEWPEYYGLDGAEIAPGFLGQTIEPFTKRKRTP